MPRIHFKNGEHAPVELSEPVTIGRSAQHADLVVEDNRLSRAHCRFEPGDDGWTVRDLDSQNGTFRNGKRVSRAAIQPGDVITIGACDMTIEDSTPQRTSIKVGGSRADRLDLTDDDSPPPDDAYSTRTVVAPAALVLKQGSLQDKIHPITGDEFKIGRKHDNDLRLDNDGKASGYHARIYRDGGDYFIEDLGSTNGVLVNGKQIKGPVRLRNGMKVVLGQQLFRFEMQGREPESTGKTAPVQHREPEPQPASQPAAGDDVEDDLSALAREVRYKGGGSRIFRVIEALVVIAVAGAILFAAWTMMKDDPSGAGGGDDGYPPAASGGLLSVNPSFEDAGDGEFPQGWSYFVSGTDAFAVVQGARGGRNALQISRFANANEASYLLSATMDLEGDGIEVSTWAINSEAASGRMGTAVVSVFWFAHKEDREPLLVTPVAVRSAMTDWTELKGSARAPEGAQAWAVSLGMAGKAGSVVFDDVSVQRNDDAESWFRPHSVRLEGGLEWAIAQDGGVSLSRGDETLLRGGRIRLYQDAGRSDALDVLAVLIRAPEVKSGEGAITASYRYFDPLAENPMVLVLELKGRGGNATLNAEVRIEGGDPLGASNHVALNALATPTWAPAEFVRFGTREGRPLEYRNEIGVRGDSTGEFGVLLSSNTGRGNRLMAPDDSRTRVEATTHPSGRELFIHAPGVLNLTVAPGDGRDELQQRVAQISAVQEGEDQTDRVNRALSIFDDFLYNQPEIAAAAAAIEAVSNHYSLQLIELRDGINVPQLTRNEQLYRNAMREAIANSEALEEQAGRWSEKARLLLRTAAGDGLNQRTRDAANRARRSLLDLTAVAGEFEELAELARRSLFLLEIHVAQRESEPYIVSARDYLDAGQNVQGMVKLRAVVENYPRCLRGTEAKERMVQIARVLMAEYDEYTAQGLNNIARDHASQVRQILDMVESRLLGSILSPQEMRWLSDIDLGGETRPGAWIDREEELKRTITRMRNRLPEEGNGD